MHELAHRVTVLGLIIVATSGVPHYHARAGEGRDEAGAKRAALWQALEKALPKQYQAIDAYAENPSLTLVLFRSGDTTLRFSVQTGKVEPVPHMKRLDRINRITFVERGGTIGDFVLWHNGRIELKVAAEK